MTFRRHGICRRYFLERRRRYHREKPIGSLFFFTLFYWLIVFCLTLIELGSVGRILRIGTETHFFFKLPVPIEIKTDATMLGWLIESVGRNTKISSRFLFFFIFFGNRGIVSAAQIAQSATATHGASSATLQQLSKFRLAFVCLFVFFCRCCFVSSLVFSSITFLRRIFVLCFFTSPHPPFHRHFYLGRRGIVFFFVKGKLSLPSFFLSERKILLLLGLRSARVSSSGRCPSCSSVD